MLALIWIGVILNHLGILKGWTLFWYIVSLFVKLGINVGENE